MTIKLPVVCLLAQFSKWERLGDNFRRTRPPIELTDFVPYIFGVLLLGGIVAAIIAYRRRNDLSRPCSDSQKLFRELCLAHNLDRASQKLLSRLAEAYRLGQPAEVFVTPRVFATDQLSKQFQGEATQISELGRRLF